ncbi:esterase/lipase family protein [Caenimonas sp. SL110]|uniref:esterase/lipase family protein n=1 Tax=Caenimonas sp. SL110 TaxID=1450524 RepID=UPI00350ED602
MLATAGFFLVAFGYAIVLAVEFALLRWLGGSHGSLRPTVTQLARAWLGETLVAPQVFCWRQPFGWRAEPDHVEPFAGGLSARGVVLIHGFVCNRGFWTPWLKRLRAAGHPFIAVNLEPVFGSIEDYTPIIEDAVDRITRATGMAPVLVCHSMGGLAARAWLASRAGSERVHRIVTIGTPHRGTWLGRFSRTANGREMRLDGEWIRALEPRLESSVNSRFVCWYSNCDNIVFPVETATLAGADNRLVPGVAHVQLAFRPEVVDATLALIAEPRG